MDLLATILTCSLYAEGDAVVRAIAEGPSGKNPYFVVNTAAPAEGAALPPTTEKEALARSRELIAQGGKLLLGLLEVPPSWIDAYGQSLESAFDPCINIAIGTAMLSEFDAACADKVPRHGERARRLERTNRRACVLRKYEAAIGAEDFADTILLELSVQQPARTPRSGRTHRSSASAPARAAGALTACSCPCPSLRRRGPPSFGLSAPRSSRSASAPFPPLPRPLSPARREGIRLPAMRLFIAEKPSLARAIAEALPGPQRRARLHIECGAGDVVAWCAGAILQVAPPEEYGDAYKDLAARACPSHRRTGSSRSPRPSSWRRSGVFCAMRSAWSTPATPIARGSFSSTRCSSFSATAAPSSVAFSSRDLRPEAVRRQLGAPLGAQRQSTDRFASRRSRVSAPTGSAA